MAQTATRVAGYRMDERTLFRSIETGSANTLLTSALPTRGNPYRVVLITVAYSAAPTQTGVIVTLTSGAGAAYSATLSTGAANAQYTVYIPAGDLIVGKDDVITVTAPAGSGVITASVAIYIEEL